MLARLTILLLGLSIIACASQTPDTPATVAAGIAEGIAATIAASPQLPTSTPVPTQIPTPTPPQPTSTPVPTPPTPTPTPTLAPTPTPTSEPTPTPTPGYVGGHPLDAAEVERYIIEYTNQERGAEGRSLLSHDSAISDISREHSKDMAESGEFEHIIDGDGPTARALDAGYDCRAYLPDGSYTYGLGENIALVPKVKFWQRTRTASQPGVTTWSVVSFHASERSIAEAVVQLWMDSPEHRAGLMKPRYRRIGVGVQVQELQRYGYIDETVYAVQNFSSCEEDDEQAANGDG